MLQNFAAALSEEKQEEEEVKVDPITSVEIDGLVRGPKGHCDDS